MNRILFPGLNLQFMIDPVAFTVFGRSIYWYGILIAVGFLLAVSFCLHHSKQFGLRNDDILDMLLFATPGAIIGARLYYIIFYLDLYRNADGSFNFAQMLRIHDGGIAIYGAIIAAALIAFAVTRYKKVPFLAMADLGVFGLFIGQCIGRWGNFVNAEAYGSATSLPWRMGITQGSQYLEVHPTFLYESLWNLLGFLLLFVLLRRGLRRFDGMFFAIYLAWYGVGRGLIEGLRTDSLYLFSTGLRISQLVGFISAALAILYLIYRFRKKPDPAQLYVNRVTQESEVTDNVGNNS